MPYLGIFGLQFEKNCCHIRNQHLQISLTAKYYEIMKMPKSAPKSTLFGCFWARILKNYCHIGNQHLQISVIAKLYKETKMLKFGTKNALLSIFDEKCLTWVFLGKNFKKTIVIFEISTLKFVYLQNFTKKQKCLNLGSKIF